MEVWMCASLLYICLWCHTYTVSPGWRYSSPQDGVALSRRCAWTVQKRHDAVTPLHRNAPAALATVLSFRALLLKLSTFEATSPEPDCTPNVIHRPGQS